MDLNSITPILEDLNSSSQHYWFLIQNKVIAHVTSDEPGSFALSGVDLVSLVASLFLVAVLNANSTVGQ